MDNYNFFTKFHQNQMKNKKVLSIARFSVQNFKVSVDLWKSYIVLLGTSQNWKKNRFVGLKPTSSQVEDGMASNIHWHSTTSATKKEEHRKFHGMPPIHISSNWRFSNQSITIELEQKIKKNRASSHSILFFFYMLLGFLADKNWPIFSDVKLLDLIWLL